MIEILSVKVVPNIDVKDSPYYNKELDDKLSEIRNGNLSFISEVNAYLDIMNYILDFASANKIKNPEELNDRIVDDAIENIVDDFETCILNSADAKCDEVIIIDYLDRLIDTFELSEICYLNMVRLKCNLLFKLKQFAEGEKLMFDLMNEMPDSVWPYVELVDDFLEFNNKEKALFYYEKGLKNALEDLDALEERADYFK